MPQGFQSKRGRTDSLDRRYIVSALTSIPLHHGRERFLRDVPLNEPATRLRLTGSGDDVFCRSISAMIGNGEMREIYHGLLHREQLQDEHLAQLGQPIRGLSFQWDAQHMDTALLHVTVEMRRGTSKL